VIKTHNYYIDILKAFNAFLFKVFDPNALGSKTIQKIEYNIGSKTLLKHKLYGNETYEYPNAIIDLQDIRVAEGVSTIARNINGLIFSPESSLLCDNLNKNERVYVETQRYILNLNVQINVESNADMFNFYHIITNNIPMNYTFVDYIYYYFIDVTDYVREWDFINNDIFNVIKMPDPTERDKEKYFSLLSVQPQLEIQSVTKYEDKENNRYYITFSILIATQIPVKLYGNIYNRVDRIVIDINSDKYDNYPVLIDITFDKYKNVKKAIILNRNDFKELTEEISSNSETDDNTNETYTEFKGYQIELDGDLSNELLSLYINPDMLNINSEIIFLTLDEKSITINYNEENNKTIIKIYNPEASIIKKYFNEQYIDASSQSNQIFELIQIFINS